MVKKVVLGIDPGTRVTGYALLEQHVGSIRALEYHYLRLDKIKELSGRVHMFHTFFTEKIVAFGVTDIALETPFLGKNAQTFLKLGYLRGILYLLSAQHECILHEFAPRQVKTAVTGFGGASKEQVAFMVSKFFSSVNDLGATVKNDVTDALAVSLCGLWHANRQKVDILRR